VSMMLISPRLVTHTIVLIVLVSIANTFLLVALLVKPFSEPVSWGMACWIA